MGTRQGNSTWLAGMQTRILDVIAASARTVIDNAAELDDASYATWATTRAVVDFDARRAVEYLEHQGCSVENSLLHQYARSQSTVIALHQIEAVAPWIECLPTRFVDYETLEQLRKVRTYVGILTFTTPAIAPGGNVAFLEVWVEDGRYSQMGTCWWIQLRLNNAQWEPDWRQIHAIS